MKQVDFLDQAEPYRLGLVAAWCIVTALAIAGAAPMILHGLTMPQPLGQRVGVVKYIIETDFKPTDLLE